MRQKRKQNIIVRFVYSGSVLFHNKNIVDVVQYTHQKKRKRKITFKNVKREESNNKIIRKKVKEKIILNAKKKLLFRNYQCASVPTLQEFSVSELICTTHAYFFQHANGKLKYSCRFISFDCAYERELFSKKKKQRRTRKIKHEKKKSACKDIANVDVFLTKNK